MIVQRESDGTFTLAINAAEMAAINRVTAVARYVIEELELAVDVDPWTLETAGEMSRQIWNLPDEEIVEAMVYPHLAHEGNCPIENLREAYRSVVRTRRELEALSE